MSARLNSARPVARGWFDLSPDRRTGILGRNGWGTRFTDVLGGVSKLAVGADYPARPHWAGAGVEYVISAGFRPVAR
jgi:hypothetical protein